MKNTLLKILAIFLCLFLFSSLISAQTTTLDVEKSYSIPSPDDNGNLIDESGTGSSFWLFFRMILVLALICLLIWFIGKLIKKRMEPGAEPDLYLKKTAQLTLAPGRTIQVVTLRNRAYVLGVSDSGISVIDKIDGKGDENESQGKVSDKELIDDMNLRAADNLTSKPKDFAAMISSLSTSSKRTEDFIKSRRLNLKNNGERK